MNQIRWVDLPGNKYLKKLEPEMLKNCCQTKQTIRQVGIKRCELPKEVEVIYDRAYVIARLKLDVIEALKIQSLEALITLMTEAWNETQNLDYEQLKAG